MAPNYRKETHITVNSQLLTLASLRLCGNQERAVQRLAPTIIRDRCAFLVGKLAHHNQFLPAVGQLLAAARSRHDDVLHSRRVII